MQDRVLKDSVRYEDTTAGKPWRSVGRRTATGEQNEGDKVFKAYADLAVGGTWVFPRFGALCQEPHVDDLDGTVNDLGRFWQAVVTITVLDEGGGPVNNAAVYGMWSGNASGIVTEMTNANGQGTVVSQNVLYKKDGVVIHGR